MSELVLHIQEPGQPSKEVPLGASLTIGRHPDCDYVLEDGKASSRHCRVAVVDGEVSVEDLGSSNKTAIEGGPPVYIPLWLERAGLALEARIYMYMYVAWGQLGCLSDFLASYMRQREAPPG